MKNLTPAADRHGTPTLEQLGLTPFFRAHLHDLLTQADGDAGVVPARVVVEHRDRYGLWAAAGGAVAIIGGRMRHEAADRLALPAVGDWILFRPPDHGDGPGRVVQVLPRSTCFVRQAAGKRTQAQVIAANVDTFFIVSAATDADFNPRRLERYLAAVRQSGAAAVMVLNKADLARRQGTLTTLERRLSQVAREVPSVTTSALDGEGADELRGWIGATDTVAFVGSSGVGKSSLVNGLLGTEAFATCAISETDQRGVHTTVRRALALMPGGGMLLDTPGLRELQLWGGANPAPPGDPISALAAACRFGNCEHRDEPGCAVQRAIADEGLDAGMLDGHRKLQREARRQATRQDGALQRKTKRERKAFAKLIRSVGKDRGKRGGR